MRRLAVDPLILFCTELKIKLFQTGIFSLGAFTVCSMWSYLMALHSGAMNCLCMAETLRLLPQEKND